MSWIEHHEDVDTALFLDLNRDHIAKLSVIGDGAYRPLAGLQNIDHDFRLVGEEGATPAARPEGADRG